MRFNSLTPTPSEYEENATRIIKTYSIVPKRINDGMYRWLEKSYILQKASVIFAHAGMHKVFFWKDVRWAMSSTDFDTSYELLKNKC